MKYNYLHPSPPKNSYSPSPAKTWLLPPPVFIIPLTPQFSNEQSWQHFLDMPLTRNLRLTAAPKTNLPSKVA